MSIWKSYSGVSKSTWLEKVDVDLKGKKSEDYHTRNSFGIQIEPWYHRDDTKHSMVIPGRSFDKIHLGCVVDTTRKPSTDDNYVIDNLVGGCSFLHMISDKDDGLSSLLKGVNFEMISSLFEIRENSDIAGDYVSELRINKEFDLHIIDKESTCHMIDLRGDKEGFFREFMRQADLIAQSNNTYYAFCQVEFDHNYIDSITQVLAMRLIWANICEAYGHSFHDHTIIIEGFVSPSIRTTEIHQDLIAITQVMAAMFSADVDIICPFRTEDSKESRRLIRQAYHVLTMEGHLGKVKAPYRGSYALEKIAFDMASKVWTEYIKTI